MLLLVSQGLLRPKDFGRKVTVGLGFSGPMPGQFVTDFEAGSSSIKAGTKQLRGAP